MANCIICNREIQEGSVCAVCARNQQANRPATSPGPSAGSGFSLNNLLKPVSPAPEQPAATPPTPPSAAGSLPPRPAPQTPNTTQPPATVLPTRPTAANLPPQTVQPPPGRVMTPPATAGAIPRPAQPSQPAPVQQQQNPSLAAVSTQASEDQAKLHKEVFSSETTGFGDEDLEIALLAGMMKDPFILEAHIGFASKGVDASEWMMKRDHLSPRYTTSWDELPVAR